MEEGLTRSMPASLIAEQSLLGCVLIDPQKISEIAGIISEDDFYLKDHTQIYLAMKQLFNESHEIDTVTLIDTLVKNGVYDKDRSQDYILSLAEIVPNALNILDYARIIKEKSLLRQLITTCGEVIDDAQSEQEEVGNIINSAQNKIFNIAQGRDSKSFKHIRDVIRDVYGTLNMLAKDKNALQGTKTGFSGLDTVLVGMGNSDFVLVGARPGMGKTSFCLNVATNVALQNPEKEVCIFSLEMSAEQLVSRVLSSEAMIGSYAMRSGQLTPDDCDRLAEATNRIVNTNIVIDDTAGITVTDMRAKLRKEISKKKELGLVVIDYLGLMQGERHTDNRALEVGDISRSLKLMAKDFNVPILCCAQLNRGTEGRQSKKPMLSDLRDSGSIEQDADVVLFLYRDDYYKNDEASPDKSAEICEVIIAKNRHGSTGSIKMGWIPQFTKFRTVADDNMPGAPS